jgi:hypothetical protein
MEAAVTLETSIGTIRVTELSMLDWPEDAGSPPYRCKFVGVGAPRGELAELMRQDGCAGAVADFRS